MHFQGVLKAMRNFGTYLIRVLFGSWLNIFLTFIDFAFGIVPMVWPDLAKGIITDVYLVRTLAGGLCFLSFFLANYLVYQKLVEQISFQADIRLEVKASEFSPSPGSVKSPFREVQNSPGGFSKQGLPDWAYLYATISINNVGSEQGKLRWEFVRDKVRLPSLFDAGSLKVAEVNDWPVVISGEKFAFRRYFRLDALFAEQDSPRAFAQALKALVESNARYRITIRYWTERLNGRTTKPRNLYIEGDFGSFHQKVLEHWSSYDFKDLAEIARLDKSNVQK